MRSALPIVLVAILGFLAGVAPLEAQVFNLCELDWSGRVDDPDPAIRTTARRCVIISGKPERNDSLLLRRYLSDDSPDVRSLALQRLVELADEQYAAGCGSPAEDSENPIRAALCLAKRPQLSMSRTIAEGFQSADPVVQLLSAKSALTLLDPNPATLSVVRLSEAARRALMERDRQFVQEALPPLRNLVESDNPEIGKAAVRVLSLLIQSDVETASRAHELMAAVLRSNNPSTVSGAAQAYYHELSQSVPTVIVEALTRCVETQRLLNSGQPGGFCFYALSKQGKAAANAVPLAIDIVAEGGALRNYATVFLAGLTDTPGAMDAVAKSFDSLDCANLSYTALALGSANLAAPKVIPLLASQVNVRCGTSMAASSLYRLSKEAYHRRFPEISAKLKLPPDAETPRPQDAEVSENAIRQLMLFLRSDFPEARHQAVHSLAELAIYDSSGITVSMLEELAVTGNQDERSTARWGLRRRDLR